MDTLFSRQSRSDFEAIPIEFTPKSIRNNNFIHFSKGEIRSLIDNIPFVDEATETNANIFYQLAYFQYSHAREYTFVQQYYMCIF